MLLHHFSESNTDFVCVNLIRKAAFSIFHVCLKFFGAFEMLFVVLDELGKLHTQPRIPTLRHSYILVIYLTTSYLGIFESLCFPGMM